MKEYIQKRIKELVADILLIEEDVYNNSEVDTENRSKDFQTVSGRIWEDGDTSDICHAAHSGGQIEALRLIAKELKIELDPEIVELTVWSDVINPGGP